MKVFCPNCGTENEGTAGGRVTCGACTATFDAPGPPVQVDAPSEPRATFATRPAPPAPTQVRPPQQVWTPNAPSSFAGPQAPSGKTNTLAIVSLVSGLVGCCALPFFGSLVGIITGFIAMSQVNAANGAEKGRELAIGGVVLGFLSCLSWSGLIVLAAIGK